MKVSELKELLAEAPDDMDVFMAMDSGDLVTACYANSDIVEVEMIGEPKQAIFLLIPCTCNEEE